MKFASSTISFSLVLLLSVSLSLACGVKQSDSLSQRSDKADSNNAAPPNDSGQSNLAGTYWSLLSITTKGEQEKEDKTAPPDVEFCRNGTWGMLHYGGAREAGKYQIKGDRIIMKTEDGGIYGDFQIQRKGNDLRLDDGKNVMHLKYLHPTDCK